MRISIIVLLLLASSLAFAQVYRWVDENGTVHYSDVPQGGAEEIDIAEPQTFESTVKAAPRPAQRQPTAQEQARQAHEYDLVQITTPRLDQVFWNVGGNIPVSLNVQPGLQSGDTVRVYLDGKAVEDFPSTGTSHQLSEVWRGSHTLRAEVVDASGQVLAQSEMVVFHVQQTSVLNN